MEAQMKEQILLLRGGKSFRDRAQALEYYKHYNIDDHGDYKSWKDWLVWSFEDQFEFIKVQNPTRDNADYEIWKIVFEKYLPKIRQNPTIIANSLGTVFILKYLVENGFPVKIKQLHLVATFVSDEFQPPDDVENAGTFGFDISKIDLIKKFCNEIHMWHSVDDPMCDIKNAEYIKSKIPDSSLHKFTDRGHFLQSTFLELFDYLRNNN
jgi:predicted alpha/beta hydrolase family esterase